MHVALTISSAARWAHSRLFRTLGIRTIRILLVQIGACLPAWTVLGQVDILVLRTGDSVAVCSVDTSVRAYTRPASSCASAISPSPFVKKHFTLADNYYNARRVQPSGAWTGTLFSDPGASWISAWSQGAICGRDVSALFSQAFTAKAGVVSASIDFRWMCDSRLGDPAGGPNPAGVYINGHALPAFLSGGNAVTESSVGTVSFDPAWLTPGSSNHLQVYLRDTDCGRAGLIYTATIVLSYDGPHQCQPWNGCAPAIASTTANVTPCDLGAPAPTRVFDDWSAKDATPISYIDWWGSVSATDQLTRPFIITIHENHNPRCEPLVGSPLAAYCDILPSYSPADGRDCKTNAQAYHFGAALSPPFVPVPGQRYWISIVEDDAASVRRGKSDFAWSGHLPYAEGCGALVQTGYDPAGNPILVTSNAYKCIGQATGVPMDMAWCLWGRGYSLQSPPGPDGPPSFWLEVWDRDTCLWTGVRQAAMDGRLFFDPPVPDGAYELRVYSAGICLARSPIALNRGELGTLTIDPQEAAADLTGDGHVDLADLALLLANMRGMEAESDEVEAGARREGNR